MPELSARGCGKWAASPPMGFVLLLQGKPRQALKSALVIGMSKAFWEVHAITSAFKNELDISRQVNEEDLGVWVGNNTRHTNSHKDLT